MKKIFFLFAMILSSCITFTPYNEVGYHLNEKKSTTTGSVILFSEYGVKNYIQEVVDGLRQELIYTGIEHDVVNISYRELFPFKDSKFARPAFGLDLKYDISKTKIITFRDFIILIDSADANKIIFTVLSAPVASATEKLNILKNNAQPDINPKFFKLKDRKFVTFVMIENNKEIKSFFIAENDNYYFLSEKPENFQEYTMIQKNKVKYIVKNNN